jgi:hypothetical protein
MGGFQNTVFHYPIGISQVISRLADLGETREEKEAREREAAKRELILGCEIFLGLIVVAIILVIVLTLAR